VWTVAADGDLGFTATSVNDRGVEFDDAQLQQDTTATASLAATVRADGIGRLWGWDNLFSLQYRTTRAGDRFEEALDITSLRSSARWRGLRVLREEPYVPDPFLETYVETELSEREESDFRHFLVRPVLGLQFTLTPHLTLKVMGGFEIEVLAPGRDFLPGAGFQLVLKPFTLLRADVREVKLEWAIDYFASDFGDRNRQTLRVTVATTLAINRFLSLGVRLDMFGVTEDMPDDMVHDRFGIAASTTVYFKATWLGRLLVP
jgi:hypothetical protein